MAKFDPARERKVTSLKGFKVGKRPGVAGFLRGIGDAARDASVHRFGIHTVDAQGNVSRTPIEMGHPTVFSATDRLTALERQHPGQKFVAHDRINGGFINSNGGTHPVKDTVGSARSQAMEHSRNFHDALARGDVKAAHAAASALATHPGASKTEQRNFAKHVKTLAAGKLPYTAADRAAITPSSNARRAGLASLSRLKAVHEESKGTPGAIAHGLLASSAYQPSAEALQRRARGQARSGGTESARARKAPGLSRAAAAHDAAVHPFGIHAVDAKGNVSKAPVEMGHKNSYSAVERIRTMEQLHPGSKFVVHNRIANKFLNSEGKEHAPLSRLKAAHEAAGGKPAPRLVAGSSEGLRGARRQEKLLGQAASDLSKLPPPKEGTRVVGLPPPASAGSKLKPGQLARLKSAHALSEKVAGSRIAGSAEARAYKTGKKGGRFYEVAGRRVYVRGSKPLAK